MTLSETCPGVCIADRLSGFCEAILNIDGVCKPGLKCCISKQLFNGKLSASKNDADKSSGSAVTFRPHSVNDDDGS
jgi:hypothetical protein